MNIPILLKELAKVGVVALTEKSVETFVETKIKPIFGNWGKEESRSIELEECLSEYLLRCYAKNNIMTTIVFGRLQKTLEDLYIPLTLEEYRDEDIKWVIDETCYNILDSYSRILIVDMAGMGKSTIVKYFACQGVNLDKCIPIVIELRRLEKNQSILEYIQTQINSLDTNIKIEEIVDIIKKGDFVIFFDGYDEIANENKSDVLDAIQEFTSKATNTKIVITSREDDDLNSLGEYKCVNIKPLTEEEAHELIKKYDNDGDISKKLIKKLKEDSSMDVLKEFLENPLLVSLLYKTFEYKEEIPYKKIDFYEQVYAALFNDHDKTKGSAYVHEKKTKLDRYQFEQILRAFGFLALKEDKIEYSDQLIHQLLEQSIKRFGWLKISVEDFLYDITHAVPFIQKDGNEYRWVHKSFMEYFASCFICYDNNRFEEKYLKKMINSENQRKYYNVLDFCYDMDTLSFRKYLILPYLKKCINGFPHYFTNEFFEHFDKKSIGAARQILINTDIQFVFLGGTQEKNKEILSEIVKEWHDSICDESKKNNRIDVRGNYKLYVYMYNNLNKLYELMTIKIPELFEKIEMVKEDDLNVEMYKKIKLNDDINNPINANEEIFSQIVSVLFEVVFNDDKVLNIDKCQKLREEIELESTFLDDNIFDL